MARIAMTLAEWNAVAHELAGGHAAGGPAGLRERIQALLKEAPREWSEQPYALELDDASFEVVRRVHATLSQHDPDQDGHGAAVAEAVWIIQAHQQRP